MRVVIVELGHRPLEHCDERIAVRSCRGARSVRLAGGVPIRLLRVDVRVLLAHEFAEGREVGGSLFRRQALRRGAIRQREYDEAGGRVAEEAQIHGGSAPWTTSEISRDVACSLVRAP